MSGASTDARGVARSLVAVVAASRSLCRLVERRPARRFAVLGELDAREPTPLGRIDDLVAWKQLEYLRIAARDLTGLDELDATGQALAELAADVLDGACRSGRRARSRRHRHGQDGRQRAQLLERRRRHVRGRRSTRRARREARGRDGDRRALLPRRRQPSTRGSRRPAGAHDRLVRGVLGPVGRAVGVPGAAEGPARAADDGLLGARWLDTAQRWLWNRPFSADDLRSLRQHEAASRVRGRTQGPRATARSSSGPAASATSSSPCSCSSSCTGTSDPTLRSPTTLSTPRRAGRGGLRRPRTTPTTLRDAYRYLRAVEHRLQLDDEQQVHTLPADEALGSPGARHRLPRHAERDAAEQLMPTAAAHALACPSHPRAHLLPAAARGLHRCTERR